MELIDMKWSRELEQIMTEDKRRKWTMTKHIYQSFFVTPNLIKRLNVINCYFTNKMLIQRSRSRIVNGIIFFSATLMFPIYTTLYSSTLM